MVQFLGHNYICPMRAQPPSFNLQTQIAAPAPYSSITDYSGFNSPYYPSYYQQGEGPYFVQGPQQFPYAVPIPFYGLYNGASCIIEHNFILNFNILVLVLHNVQNWV